MIARWGLVRTHTQPTLVANQILKEKQNLALKKTYVCVVYQLFTSLVVKVSRYFPLPWTILLIVLSSLNPLFRPPRISIN